jgi:hypothetical protein
VRDSGRLTRGESREWGWWRSEARLAERNRNEARPHNISGHGVSQLSLPPAGFFGGQGSTFPRGTSAVRGVELMRIRRLGERGDWPVRLSSGVEKSAERKGGKRGRGES